MLNDKVISAFTVGNMQDRKKKTILILLQVYDGLWLGFCFTPSSKYFKHVHDDDL